MTTHDDAQTERPPAEAAQRAASGPAGPGTPCPLCRNRLNLTPAQHTLLTYNAHGLAIHEIGQRHVPPLTRYQVHEQTAVLLARLDARNRVHAVDIGCRAGLVELQPDTRLPAPLTPLQAYVVVCLARGATRSQTVTILGISPRDLTTALRQVNRILGLPSGRPPFRHVLRLLHSAQALPTSLACPCTPDEPLPSPDELVRLTEEAFHRTEEAKTAVQGAPCPRCDSRIRLTTEEHQVLTMVARGRTNAEIDAHFGTKISGGDRVRSLRKKLGAAHRSQLVSVGWRYRLLPLPEPLPAPLAVSDQRDRDALIRIADGWDTRGAAASVQLTNGGMGARLATINRRLGITDGHLNPQAVYLLHALGDILPDSHPCPCAPAGETAAPA
ncbi:hypothetical protein ABTX81_30720 [Kitasatospora sp. NPDC097605]|uniref:helix-turn-helix transcriptional regulator n=1 Tax=Kitasatospora sp. NPDC097605 TaxID=3157226 RepID=UPI00332E3C36